MLWRTQKLVKGGGLKIFFEKFPLKEGQTISFSKIHPFKKKRPFFLNPLVPPWSSLFMADKPASFINNPPGVLLEIEEKMQYFGVFGYNVLKIQLLNINLKKILWSTNWIIKNFTLKSFIFEKNAKNLTFFIRTNVIFRP